MRVNLSVASPVQARWAAQRAHSTEAVAKIGVVIHVRATSFLLWRPPARSAHIARRLLTRRTEATPVSTVAADSRHSAVKAHVSVVFTTTFIGVKRPSRDTAVTDAILRPQIDRCRCRRRALCRPHALDVRVHIILLCLQSPLPLSPLVQQRSAHRPPVLFRLAPLERDVTLQPVDPFAQLGDLPLLLPVLTS